MMQSEETIQRGKKLYEGKAKVLFATEDPHRLIQYFKDDATAFNGVKKGAIHDKGVINNKISEHLMHLLDAVGIPTHFIQRLNEREQWVKSVTILPVEVVVRNRVAGSMARRLGRKEGEILPRPVVEFYYKSDALDDPIITRDHIDIFGWASKAELAEMVAYTYRINDILLAFFANIDIILVDYKLEFGRLPGAQDGEVVLADEISPDSCRLWDRHTGKKLDKDRFRQDLGGVSEAYHEVASRMGLLT